MAAFQKVDSNLLNTHQVLFMVPSDDDVMNVVDHFCRAKGGTFYTEGLHLLHDHLLNKLGVTLKDGTMLKKDYLISFMDCYLQLTTL